MANLEDARKDAREAVESYNALDRNERMDQGILTEHAKRFHGALGSLVAATDGESAVSDERAAAREALSEFEDPTSYGSPQQVRRACYVLRSNTKTMLDALENG